MAALQDARCEDVQFLLRNLRVLDDKIIYELNRATPTSSFQEKVNPAHECERLFKDMASNYKQRESLLKSCLNLTADRIVHLKEVNDGDSNRKIKAEKSRARELRNELDIEEILRERSRKVFSEKCYPHYRGYEGW